MTIIGLKCLQVSLGRRGNEAFKASAGCKVPRAIKVNAGFKGPRATQELQLGKAFSTNPSLSLSRAITMKSAT